jgi:hypothetical protein
MKLKISSFLNLTISRFRFSPTPGQGIRMHGNTPVLAAL